MATIQDLWPRYLHTERLTLELYDSNNPDMVECMLAGLNSPTAIERAGDFGVRTLQDLRAMIPMFGLRGEKFANGQANELTAYMPRIGANNPDGKLIGYVSLAERVAATPGGPYTLPPDIGWALIEGEMGKGYATEAATEVLRFLREDYSQKEIIVFPNEHNRQSNRVAEKLGFVDGGRCPDLDCPGREMSIWMLSGMTKLNDVLKDGMSFKFQ